MSVSTRRKTVNVVCLILLSSLAAGCGKKAAPGGNSPLTVQRLQGARLNDIRDDVSWRFAATTLVIENKGQPIPADLISALQVGNKGASRVEASWQFDEQAGTLRLSQLTADGKKLSTDVSIPIQPAGHVRVNLGDRQYNLLRN